MGGVTTPEMLYTLMAWKGPIFLQIAPSTRFDTRNKVPSAVLPKSQTAGSAYQCTTLCLKVYQCTMEYSTFEK